MPRIAVLLSAGLLAVACLSPVVNAGQASVFDQVGAITSRTALAADRPVAAPHAMVVTAQHYATEAGLEILKKGGNAIDAAVATGYALAVVDPCCGNIGGGGFMTIHLANGRNLFLDFREKAPLKATPTMYQDAHGNVVPGLSTKSWLSIGVPGTVMGLNEALVRYGTMSRAEVMAPAIRLARDGFVLESADVKRLNSHAAVFAKEPNVAAIFLNHGKPYKIGEILKQPQLAHTLEQDLPEQQRRESRTRIKLRGIPGQNESPLTLTSSEQRSRQQSSCQKPSAPLLQKRGKHVDDIAEAPLCQEGLAPKKRIRVSLQVCICRC